MDIIEVNHNFYPMDMTRMLITKSMRSILPSIQSRANLICRNHVNEGYLHYAFRKFSHGYVYHTGDGLPTGFVVWKEYKEQPLKGGGAYSFMYILLICAEENDFSFGKRILEDVDKYASRNNFNYIQLEPMNNALREYYTRSGYISDPAGPLMKKSVTPPVYINRNSSNRRRFTRRRSTRSITNEQPQINV